MHSHPLPRRAAAVITSALALLAPLVVSPAALAAATAETVVSVVDFGADPSGATDSAAAVKAALTHAKSVAGPVRITFPTGTYQLYPEAAEKRDLYMSNTVGTDARYTKKAIGILVEGRDDVTVDGEGSTFQFHGAQTAFAAIKAKNVRFEDFTFDYVSPRTVDASIVDVGVENAQAYRVLSVPADTNYSIVNGTSVRWRGENIPGTTTPYWTGLNTMGYSQYHDPRKDLSWRSGVNPFANVASITDLGDHRIKIVYNSSTMPTDGGLMYQMRDTIRDTAAAFFWESQTVTVDSVHARYLHGFGYLGQLSRDITIQNSQFESAPGNGKNTVGFADIVQMSGVAGTVTLKNNVFDGAHDDPINIHGTYMQVVAKPAPDQVTVRYMHAQSSGFPQFYTGDSVEFVTKSTMAAAATGFTVKNVISTPPGDDPKPLDSSGNPIPLNLITIQLDKPIPDAVTTDGQTVAENITYTPKVVVEDNVFRNLPTRGLLVTTRQPVSVQRNVFDGQGMASIYISSDAASWYESGPVRDVLIKDNIFRRPTTSAPVIYIQPTNGVLDPAKPVHENIRIENNTFEMNGSNIVDAKSVKGLSITGNTVKRIDRDRVYAVSVPQACLAPGAASQASLVKQGANRSGSAYVLRGSSDVILSGNRYDPGFAQKISLVSTDAASVTVSGESTSTAGFTSPWASTGTYTSSDPSVLTVSSTGVITAVKAGTAEIRASVASDAGAISAQVATVRVSSKPCAAGNDLASNWSVTRDSPATRTATPDGALLLTPTNGFLYATNNTARVVVNQQSDGTGDAVVKMTGMPGQTWAEGGLVLYGGDNDYIALERKMNNGSPSITAVLERGGLAEESRLVMDTDAASVWLKISRAADQAQALYSLDGTTWTKVGSPMPTTGLSAKFGLLAASNLAGHSPFRFSDYREDGTAIGFSAASPGTPANWSILRDNPALRTVNADESLSLIPAVGYLWANWNNAMVMRSSASDGTGTVTVKMTGRTVQRWAEAGLVLYYDDNNYVTVQRKHNNGNPTITAVVEKNGVGEESRRVTDPANDSVWLKLTRTGTTAQASYSLDGTTWTALGGAITVGAGAAKFGILAANDRSDHPAFTFSDFTEDGTVVAF